MVMFHRFFFFNSQRHKTSIFLWLSDSFLWFSYGFPMVFLWLSYGFPMAFPWFSYGFLIISCRFPKVSDGFPVDKSHRWSLEETLVLHDVQGVEDVKVLQLRQDQGVVHQLLPMGSFPCGRSMDIP